ncbi:hypothetical protein [Methylobacterium sp. Gmos1]
MAKADRHNMGPGAQGKGSGTGAMTELPEGILEENMVLSNRDKSQHGAARGLDSKHVQTEQYHDHASNRRNFDQTMPAGAEQNTSGNTSGLEAPMTTGSGEDSELARRQQK